MKSDEETYVSVIIPTYKEGKYIGRLLSALISLDNSLEIIVVDGGSDDNTIATAKQYTEKVFLYKERGISKARNYGARKANGDILIFLDADVIPSPDMVEKTLMEFADSTVAGATCNIMPFEPKPFEKAFFAFYNFLLRITTWIKPHSRGEFLVARRRAFSQANGFDESLACIEDHDFAFRLSKIGKFRFISSLTLYETMRRIRKLGLMEVVKTWTKNYLSFMLLGKTFAKVWSPVR